MKQLERYELREEIGRGGMARVYKAFDPRFERDVAIKLLPPATLLDPSFKQRFQREATTIASLEHHSIVPVYDFGESEERPFLVMRYMRNGSLEDKLQRGEVSVEDALSVVKRIGSALDYAHQRGVIHRDVKPANILYGEDGVPYLSDFGIVKLSEASVQFTKDGFLGTPYYMAPESADPDGTTTLIDIYALGVTLFQMLTGKVPYDGQRPSGILMAHVTKPIPDVRESRADLPAEVQAVIEKAMAKQPATRYQHGKPIGRDLEEALRDYRRTTDGHGSTPVAAAVLGDPNTIPQAPAPIEKTPWKRAVGWILGAIFFPPLLLIVVFKKSNNSTIFAKVMAVGWTSLWFLFWLIVLNS